MASLISRLEAATGPDRGLDAEIAKTQGWTLEKMKGDAKPYWRKPGVTYQFMRTRGGPPAYTGSLDAAMTLLTEHCGIELTRSITFACDAVVYGQDMHASAEGATLPLALCGRYRLAV